MNQYKNIGTLLTIILLGLLTGCSNKENKEQQAVAVVVQKVASVDEGQIISYSGTIEESTTTPLSFSVVGTVARVLVSEGDFVKKGQLLAVLNNESYKNAYEMSLAAEQQAEDAIKRLEPMYKSGNLPEIKLVEVKTSLQQAKAATAIAKKNVTDCNLVSPVSGYVGKRAIDPGMTALPNVSSITIVDINKVFARVPVPENEISNLKNGQFAHVKVVALQDAVFTGKVEEIGVLADFMAHTYKIKIALINKEKKLRPGMVCDVVMQNAITTNGIVVPEQAIQMDEQHRNFVFLAENGKAAKRFVKVGQLRKNGIEILEGLKESEQIVISGQQKLVDNIPIEIVNEEQAK